MKMNGGKSVTFSNFEAWWKLRLGIDDPVSDLPCNVRREAGSSLLIGGSSLVILEGKACNPL